MTFYELAPLNTEFNTVVDSKVFGKGVLVPYVSFDPEYVEGLRIQRAINMASGILPMSFLTTKYDSPLPMAARTHTTQYTEALDEISIAANAGVLPRDSLLTACEEIIAGTFDPKNYTPEENLD